MHSLEPVYLRRPSGIVMAGGSLQRLAERLAMGWAYTGAWLASPSGKATCLVCDGMFSVVDRQA